MTTKKILIFTGFVGGLGGSKKAAWLYSELKSQGYDPIVVSESSYVYKINGFKMKPAILIDKKSSNQEIYQECWEKLKNVDFDLMISFGPRTFGPYAAYKKKIPYFIIDGGLPPFQKKFPSDHMKEIYDNCEKYILTCHFPWNFSKIENPAKTIICAQPYPNERMEKYKNLRDISKEDLKKQLINDFPELKNDYDLFIYLNITSEYANPDIIEPNGWLKQKEYNQIKSFMNKLATELGDKYNGKILMYIEDKLVECAKDNFNKASNINVFNRDSIDPDTDILLKKLADINICRATRCDKQSELALIGKCAITTPCPTNYMDEDTAALEANNRGITKLINANDLQYADKLLKFSKNKKEQKQIENRLTNTFDQMWKNNNPWKIISAQL